MINVPVKDIITKIKDKSGLSEEEIKSKIKTKVDQLYGLVSEEGAAHIIANELGIKVFEASGDLKIKDILIGMKSVDVVGRVIRKYEMREFSTEKRKGKVANLLMADDTTSIRVVFWNDKTDDFVQIKENDIIKIKAAYVRDNAGRKELHLGDNSQVIINPEGVAINARERKEYDRKHISELTDGLSAEVVGTIVQVFDIKFFEVCSKCNKRMRLKGDALACDEHGAIEPTYNYVMNVYLDDGTANIRVNFWKSQTQKLLLMADGDIQLFRTSPEKFENVKNDLLGEQVKVLGNVKNNIMSRLELVADIVYRNLKPDQEIEMLDHAKEVVLQTETKSPKAKVEGDDEFEISEDFLE